MTAMQRWGTYQGTGYGVSGGEVNERGRRLWRAAALMVAMAVIAMPLSAIAEEPVPWANMITDLEIEADFVFAEGQGYTGSSTDGKIPVKIKFTATDEFNRNDYWTDDLINIKITDDNGDDMGWYGVWEDGDFRNNRSSCAPRITLRPSDADYSYEGGYHYADVYVGVNNCNYELRTSGSYQYWYCQDGTDNKGIASADKKAFITVSIIGTEFSYTEEILVASPSDPLTALAIKDRSFTDGGDAQYYGAYFFHGDTKETADKLRMRLQAVKTPHWSNELVVWSISGEAADKYELWDARTGGNLVPFNTETDVANVFMSVKAGATLDARDFADNVTVSVASAVNNNLISSAEVEVGTSDMRTITGYFYIYQNGEEGVGLYQFEPDEMLYVYLVDTQEKTEPQQRDANWGYELNINNALAQHQFHVTGNGLLLLDDVDNEIVPNNTKIFTPYDYKGGDYEPSLYERSIFNFRFVRLPRISGTVKDPSGNPIAGAAIIGGVPARTDADGNFTIMLSQEAYRERAGETAVITAIARGYESGAASFTVGSLDVAKLKTSEQDVNDIVITLTPIGTGAGNPFTDADKNALRVTPSMVTSGQFSSAMGYLYSNSALTNAAVKITADNGAELKDANGMMYVYELPFYSMQIAASSVSGGEMNFTVPELKANTEYFISFGVNAPPLGAPRVNQVSNVTVKVNNHTAASAVIAVNDLTVESPAEVGIDDALNVYGSAAMASGSSLILNIKDIQTGTVVATRTISQPVTRYAFENVTWVKTPGVYELSVTLDNAGQSATVSRTLIVTPAPVKITSVSFYDTHSPQIVIPNPSANLVFPIHVWLQDEWRLYDARKPYRIAVGIEAETRDIDGETGGEIVNVEAVIETSHGAFAFPMTGSGNSGVYTAEIAALAGVGVAQAFVNVTQKSFNDPTVEVTSKIKAVNLSLIVDPSGYVYDAETEERIEGATATLYRKDEGTGNWAKWDAESYQQINPQTTDEEGKYGWMVPEGDYEVRITGADGVSGFAKYQPYSTRDDAKYGVITVLPAREDINIALARSHNKVTVNKGAVTNASEDGTYAVGATVNIKADEPETGYKFKNWTASGATLADPQSESTSFTMPANTVTATAHYEMIVYTITATAGTGGNATGSNTYAHGANVELVATADVGYTFDGWYEGATKVSTNATYTFTAEATRTLEARFTLNTYVITATAGTGGDVTGSNTYNHGASVELTATADVGYTFDGWYDGATKVSTNATYTFTAEAIRTLEARFTLNTYAITATAGTGGIAEGSDDYNHGASVELTATADRLYV